MTAPDGTVVTNMTTLPRMAQKVQKFTSKKYLIYLVYPSSIIQMLVVSMMKIRVKIKTAMIITSVRVILVLVTRK